MKRKQLTAALTAFVMMIMGTTGVLLGIPGAEVVLTASAEEYHGLTYEVQEDGTIIITGCDETLTSVEIPAEIEGKTVMSIGDGAFRDCTGLTDITIPDSLTSIGGFAFMNCTELTNITIPDSLTNIGEHAFMNCTRLTNITIPDNGINIGEYAFCGCTGLTSVTIPVSITSIEFGLFSDCTGLTDITILNPDCYFNYFNVPPFPETAIIHGYENSTAQSYAEEIGYTFLSLGNVPDIQPLYGDTNDDGEVTIVDVVKLCRCAMGADTLTKTGAANADVDGNGTADATDASYIIQSLVGLVTLPIAAGRR